MPGEVYTESAVEERPFVIGPLSPEVEEFIPEYIRKNLQRVRDEGIDGNDANIKVPGITAAIGALITEIDGYLKRCLLSGILTQRQCSDAMERIAAAGRGKGLEHEPEVVTNVYERVLNKITMEVKIALEEALVNHLEHGNKDPFKTIEGKYWVDSDGHFHSWSFDHGDGFEPAAIADPTDSDHLEIPNGRGLLLEKMFMDTVEYGSQGTSGQIGTSVHMTKLTGTLTQRMVEADEDDDPEDGEKNGFPELALDRYVRHAMHGILDDRQKNQDADAKKEAERVKNKQLREAWFGAKQKLITWLEGKWTVREHLSATVANIGKRVRRKTKDPKHGE